ncbi:hypothetical protein N9A54_03165 [Porticoccaceae bacterium]|nr:hypothetical protein [Porticoccaceae bacterium]
MDLLKTSALFCIALLLGCDSNVPAYKLIERDGIMHESGSQAPFTGRSVLHHDNGQLWAIKDFKDGKMNGLYERYEEGGQLIVKALYKDGEKTRAI